MTDLIFTDVIRHMRDVPDTRALWHLLSNYYTTHGIEKISYHLYPGVATPSDADVGPSGLVTVHAQGFSEDWVCRYIEQKLFLIDPIPDLARSAAGPFFWSEVGNLMRLSDAQKEFLTELVKAGTGDGLAMHVYGPNMCNAYVGLGFGMERPELSPQIVTEYQCIAQMGHLRYCEMVSEVEARRFDLAPREREILHWIARGKSNAAIAVILEVSPHTIDTLTRRLFDKLKVTDRTSAAIRGVGAGLVLPG